MRNVGCCLVAAAALALAPVMVQAQDANRAVANGGIKAPGWAGQVDASAAKQGQGVKDALLEPAAGGGLHVMTGPAITYWQTGKSVSGNYTVSATFTEPKFMNLNTHPHPYGIVIAGNDMGGASTYLYCAAYGNGTFIVRGMGPDAFQMGGRQPTANAAVHKAAAVGQPVMQDIAMSVKGDQVTCSINGAVVATYTKAELVTAGKLKSTDGAYGIRFAHNTEAIVTNFKVTKN